MSPARKTMQARIKAILDLFLELLTEVISKNEIPDKMNKTDASGFIATSPGNGRLNCSILNCQPNNTKMAIAMTAPIR